jgi:hypothetical protein
MEDFQQKRNASLSSLLKAAQAANREEEKVRRGRIKFLGNKKKFITFFEIIFSTEIIGEGSFNLIEIFILYFNLNCRNFLVIKNYFLNF